DNVPAFAASAGAVTFAANTSVGHTVIFQHTHNWSTYYTHLSTLAVAKGQQVPAGQTLGTIGASPTDGEHLVHLLCRAAHKRCYGECSLCGVGAVRARFRVTDGVRDCT